MVRGCDRRRQRDVIVKAVFRAAENWKDIAIQRISFFS